MSSSSCDSDCDVPPRYDSIVENMGDLTSREHDLDEEKVYAELYKHNCIQVAQNWGNLKNVHERNQTEKLCMIAVKQDYLALKHVATKFKTPKLCSFALKQDERSIVYLLDQCNMKKTIKYVNTIYEQLDHEQQIILVTLRPKFMQYFPHIYGDYPTLYEIVSHNPMALQYIQFEYISIIKRKVVQQRAVKANGLALQYIIPAHQTDDICKWAVKQNPDAEQYIHKKDVTKNITCVCS
jgi:hypothetical protein